MHVIGALLTEKIHACHIDRIIRIKDCRYSILIVDTVDIVDRSHLYSVVEKSLKNVHEVQSKERTRKNRSIDNVVMMKCKKTLLQPASSPASYHVHLAA